MFEVNITGKKKTATGQNLLMHFEGSNGSSDFKDEYGRTFSLVGTPTPTLTSLRSKFGVCSGAFKNNGLAIPQPMKLKGDYTIECWVYLVELPTSRAGIASHNPTSNGSLMMLNSGGNIFLGYWLEGSATGSTWASASIVANKWYHVAATRQGGVYRLFSNGNLIHTSAVLPIPEITINLLFHYAPSESIGFSGNADELLITDGTAKYVTTFTPPTAPFTS